MSATAAKVYPGNYEQIFSNAHSALQECGFNIKASDLKSAQIMASASMSLGSYGERIEVNFYTIPEGVQVQMRSTPYTMDWGKSKKNVANFFAVLDRHQSQERSSGYQQDPNLSRWRADDSQPVRPEEQSYQSYTEYQTHQTEPSPTTPAVLAFVNGLIAFLLAFFYMGLWYVLGYFLIVIAILLFMGGLLIAAKNYKAGAVLCAIGGVITIPIGMLGIIAASKAWGYSKWEKRDY